ncbi:hypothetical protein PVK06_039839 [Gossypium arboreum]|uniref:Uncharacterized protein n=1 Tax=Gossypium arboreum TaxID=29729 RepID=A0ABR0N3X8_GOSAR|nr:hypothetical protein PVK06_039839 [Gossypium arboreum]
MAEKLFDTNGFQFPALRNPSDHYLRTINKDFVEDIEQGICSNNTEKIIDTLFRSYKSSEICKQVQQNVLKISQQATTSFTLQSTLHYVYVLGLSSMILVSPLAQFRYVMYYIAFHEYANQGIYKNECEGLSFPNNQARGSPTITGDEVLRSFWQVEMGYSKWVDVGILFGMVVIYRLLFWGIINTVDKVKPFIKSYMAVPLKQSSRILENPSPISSS